MRYKEFSPNRVLEKSITIFWQKGFNGCSINDLVKTTRVNRFSLYQEFENKEGILYASLNLYRERYCKDKLEILKSDRDLVPVLKQFYMSYLEDNKPVPGCYFIHVGTEQADSDDRVRESLNKYLNEIESFIKSLLIRNGYSSKVDLYAKHLLGLFCTAMSFCLIHTLEERENYLSNGINIILSKYAQST